MGARRLITPLIQLLVLLLAIGLLVHSWHTNPPPPPPVGGGDNDEDDVKYSPTVLVSVAPVTRGTLHGYVVAYGTVEPEPGVVGRPSAGADVRVPVPAVVAEVKCIEGQHVEKGQVLFTLDPRNVDAAIERARQELQAAKENLDRFAKAHDLPEQYRLRAQRDREQAQVTLDAATAQQALLTFTSPITGTIVKVQIRPGDVADPSTTSVQVVDLNRLVIAVNVPAWQLHAIKVGQEAEIIRHEKHVVAAPTTSSASQPASPTAAVRFVDPQVDTKTGMGSVDVSVPPETKLRLGEFAGVRIVSGEHRDCLTVPAKSLTRHADGRWGVSVAVRDFQWAFWHPVKVGLTEGDRVEVEGEGVKAGDYVVTTGAYALPDKCRIEVLK